MFICSNCKTEKHPEHFYRHPKSKSGHQSRCKECTRQAARAAYKADPVPTKVRATERQRLVDSRIPPWANRSAIYCVYREAKRLSEETGVQHHVDHIVPINSKLVCGLHTEANLQVLTAEDNMLKSNKLLQEI